MKEGKEKIIVYTVLRPGGDLYMFRYILHVTEENLYSISICNGMEEEKKEMNQ